MHVSDVKGIDMVSILVGIERYRYCHDGKPIVIVISL